jgi:hypothetical protein
MSLSQQKPQYQPLATAGAASGLFQQVFMAGSAAVITVTFIHPIDVVKVSLAIGSVVKEETSRTGVYRETKK